MSLNIQPCIELEVSAKFGEYLHALKAGACSFKMAVPPQKLLGSPETSGAPDFAGELFDFISTAVAPSRRRAAEAP
jgi:hypothetical protein